MRSKSNRRRSIACRPSDASIFESHPSRSGSWREYIVHRHTTRYSPWCACVWCVLCDSQVFLLPVLNLSITLSIHIALCHHDHLCVCHCCRHSITASSERNIRSKMSSVFAWHSIKTTETFGRFFGTVVYWCYIFTKYGPIYCSSLKPLT
jgi:hypothetical protein